MPFPLASSVINSLPQKVNCVQFNEEASVILSGETQYIIQNAIFIWKRKYKTARAHHSMRAESLSHSVITITKVMNWLYSRVCLLSVSRVHRWNSPLLGHQVSKERSHPGSWWGSWQHQQPEGGATWAAYWVSTSRTRARILCISQTYPPHTTAAVETCRSADLHEFTASCLGQWMAE